MATRRPRPKRPGSRYKSRGRGPMPTWIYVAGAVVALGLIGALIYKRMDIGTRTAIDAQTLCPVATGPVARMAILFDLTDPLGPAQRQSLMQYIDREIDNAATGTQVTFGIVSETPADWGASPALCKPRTAREASAATSNLRQISERYDNDFLAPVHVTIDRMIRASSAKQSPIMEALQALVAGTPGFLTDAAPRKVIVISDLLQNSDAMSFYRGDDWQSFAASPAFHRLGRTLEGADVMIFAAPRAPKAVGDPAAIEDFWIRYFDRQGAHLPRVTVLGDL